MTADEQLDYVHRLLEDAGDEWRSELAPPVDVDAGWFKSAPRIQSPIFATVTVVVAVVVLAVVAGLLGPRAPRGTIPSGGSSVASDPSADPTSATAAPASIAPASASLVPTITNRPLPSPTLTDEIVREGDLVTMAGRILEFNDGPVICAEVIYAGFAYGCGGPAMLSLRGLDVRTVPGSYNEYSQGWITQTVTVVGHWRGGAIEVTEWTLGGQPIDLYGSRKVPCDPPDGGWAPGSGSERASLELDHEIEQHPGRYGGYWGVHEGSTYIPVIATTDDVDLAKARLARIYTHNLCVTHVSIGEADLQRAAADLGYRESAFAMELTLDGVVLYVPVVDALTLVALGPSLEGLSLRGFAEKVPAETPSPPPT